MICEGNSKKKVWLFAIVCILTTFTTFFTVSRYPVVKIAKSSAKSSYHIITPVTLKDYGNYTVNLQENKNFEIFHNICLNSVLHKSDGDISTYYHFLYQLPKVTENPGSCLHSLSLNDSVKMINGKVFKIDNMLSTKRYYWVILPPFKAMPCKALPQIKDVLYLPNTYSHAENAGHFLLDLLPYYYNLVRTSQKYLPVQLQPLRSVSSQTYSTRSIGNTTEKSDIVFLAPQFFLYDRMVKKNIDFMRGLGVDKVLFHTGAEEPQCYRFAFTGSLKKTGGIHQDILDHFRRYFNVTSKACKQGFRTAVMIQRNSSRQILNLNELVIVAKSLGYDNVVVLYLEHHSVAEQMQSIYCADMLLGVQGSGMVWYKYLPPGAVYIEVGYEDWTNHFFTDRASDRMDLQLYNMQCRGIIPERVYLKTAKKWFDYQGNLTEEIKEKVLKTSKERSKICHTQTVWMDSHCKCDPHLLEDILLGKAPHAKKPFA